MRSFGKILALSLLCAGHGVSAGPAPSGLSAPSGPSAPGAPLSASLSDAEAMVVLDHANLALTSGGRFDLMGLHYLQQLTPWLYGGIGASAPMFEGNYGGFFSADVTLHAQVPLGNAWFATAGLAYGAGAGGASIAGIIALSGDGTYMRRYIGLGRDFGGLRAGVNIANITIANSPINDTTLDFFLQKPLRFSVGGYSATQSPIDPADYGRLGQELDVSFEVSRLRQINPTGSYTGPLTLVSTQVSSYFSERGYAFAGLDLGAGGLIWYNQAQAGIGRRFALGKRLNLYAQLGIGSGGWVTSAFDTGPGMVIYPKVRLEYAISDRLAATLSAGYLFAPLGSSKNWSLGLGLSYRMPSAAQAAEAAERRDHAGIALRGLRANVFFRRQTGLVVNGSAMPDLDLLAMQLDYSLSPHWYIPFQIAAATEPYNGYAGYVEGLAGLGWQSAPLAGGRLRAYAQITTGLNDAVANPGPLIYTAAGISYDIDERLAVYSQLGKTISLGQRLNPGSANSFESTSLGLGISYQFSLATWARR